MLRQPFAEGLVAFGAGKRKDGKSDETKYQEDYQKGGGADIHEIRLLFVLHFIFPSSLQCGALLPSGKQVRPFQLRLYFRIFVIPHVSSVLYRSNGYS